MICSKDVSFLPLHHSTNAMLVPKFAIVLIIIIFFSQNEQPTDVMRILMGILYSYVCKSSTELVGMPEHEDGVNLRFLPVRRTRIKWLNLIRDLV